MRKGTVYGQNTAGMEPVAVGTRKEATVACWVAAGRGKKDGGDDGGVER